MNVYDQLDSIDGLPECIIKLADFTVYMCNTYFKSVLATIKNELNVTEWAIEDKQKKVNSLLLNQKLSNFPQLQEVKKDFY
jgi:hypothetical protein